MSQLPPNPRAVVEIERPSLAADGQRTVRYDSWDTKRLVKEVDVELATNQSSDARITVFDPHFRVVDAFSPETSKAVVKVYLGYGEELGQPVFKGILTEIERNDSDTTFVVPDMAFVMKMIKKAGYKNKSGDLGIIQGLVTRNLTPQGTKLKFEGPEIPKKLEPHNAMMQDMQTDWEWMMERARDAGLMIFVRQDTVFAKYPAKTAGRPALVVRVRDLTHSNDHFAGWNFTYRTPESLDGRPKVVKHQRRGRGGKFIRGTTSEEERGRDETVIKRDIAGPTKGKLKARAEAQKELEREHAYEGRLTIPMPKGGTRLDVRNTIQVLGIGKMFSGKYVARTVNYKFSEDGLSMELDLYRDAEVRA